MIQDSVNPVLFTIIYTFGPTYFCSAQNTISINIDLKKNDLLKSTFLIEKLMLDKIRQIDNTISIPAFDLGSIVNPSILTKFSNISEFIDAGQRIPTALTYDKLTNNWIMPHPIYDTKIKTYNVRGLINTNNHKLYDGSIYNFNLEL